MIPETSRNTDIPFTIISASLKCLSSTESVITTSSATPSLARFCTTWAMLTSLFPRTPAIFARAPGLFAT